MVLGPVSILRTKCYNANCSLSSCYCSCQNFWARILEDCKQVRKGFSEGKTSGIRDDKHMWHGHKLLMYNPVYMCISVPVNHFDMHKQQWTSRWFSGAEIHVQCIVHKEFVSILSVNSTCFLFKETFSLCLGFEFCMYM